ncbi:peptidase family M48-domain-containing protein [Mycena alexandri]|uniref:Peptidase family M48-domain-containing protein n=1 Tax=Mycena alexandri TaxID=1745969 RepID=A0AAD6SWE3_9AGAR|nr:peptidase family M48-domain-containing protein [Mycena alexandri]
MLRASACKILSAPFRAQPLSTLVRSPHNPLRTPKQSRLSTRSSLILPAGSHGSISSILGTSAFHSTSRRKALPVLPFLALLKASATMELLRTAGRVVLTLLPVLFLTRGHIEYHLKHDAPLSERKIRTMLRKIRTGTWLFRALFVAPIILFSSTVLASMERTPLTGRWRLIILSPEEEDEIAAQLKDPGWYQAVNEILTQDGPQHLIPPTDWRYRWVHDTLRELERTIPVLLNEREICENWSYGGPDDIPLPPPAEYPLRPRPRATEYLRMWSDQMCNKRQLPVPHYIPGPPYSLLVVDKPEASNAFSYGFGPDGAGGIVVYSGFLDEILARALPEPEAVASVVSTPEPQMSSLWSSLVGSVFGSSPPPPIHPVPTPSQTAELAVLLAHELSHLVLSHHLETLSSTTIIIPGVLSILSDFIRVAIFPVTMIFGPFVNDAVGQMGKLGSSEVDKVREYFTSVHQEVEADVVSARLLAHAGYDARNAVTFWERRTDAGATECSSANERKANEGPSTSFALKLMGSKHPVNEVRVNRLKEELLRWETERRAEVQRRAVPPTESKIVLALA